MMFRIIWALQLLSLLPTLLNNHFPHNQHMALSSSNAINAVSGSKKPPMQDNKHLCINMVNLRLM
jgi:hypothetical protein